MWLTSNAYYCWVRWPEGSTWYCPSPWYGNPLCLGGLAVLVQTLSHIAEDLPPRASLTDHWMSFGAFFRRNWPRSRIVVCFGMLLPAVFGAINEVRWCRFFFFFFFLLYLPPPSLLPTPSFFGFLCCLSLTFFTSPRFQTIASPRLFPLLVLRYMYSLGYRKDLWQNMQAVIQQATSSGKQKQTETKKKKVIPPPPALALAKPNFSVGGRFPLDADGAEAPRTHLYTVRAAEGPMVWPSTTKKK
jgi:hypothetical protein